MNIFGLSFIFYFLKLSTGTGLSVVSEILQIKRRAWSRLSCRQLETLSPYTSAVEKKKKKTNTANTILKLQR